MEITNYKLKDFFKIKDENLIIDYLVVLENLKPLSSATNPRKRWYNNQPKSLKIKNVIELSFGDVYLLKELLSEGTIDSVLQAVGMVTGIQKKYILNFTITEFYGIISKLKVDIQTINNMEENELTDDSFDFNLEALNAPQRMAKFGVLNTIDSLVNGDLTKWEQIEKLPYLTVFTKLKMDKEKNKIQLELAELQKKQQK